MVLISCYRVRNQLNGQTKLCHHPPPPTTTYHHPPPPTTTHEVAKKPFYMALAVKFPQEMVSVNQLLCETSLLLKKDRCSNADSV